MLSAAVEVCCGCLVFEGEVGVCMRYLNLIMVFVHLPFVCPVLMVYYGFTTDFVIAKFIKHSLML